MSLLMEVNLMAVAETQQPRFIKPIFHHQQLLSISRAGLNSASE